MSKENLADTLDIDDKIQEDEKTYYLILSVAFYNMGVEYEYLHDLNEAMNAINQASTIAKLHLGKDNYTHLTTKIEESKSKIMELKKRANSRMHSLRAAGRITKGTMPKTQFIQVTENNDKQYNPSQRQKVCQTDVRSEFSGHHVKNVSEERTPNLNQRIEKLPHLVQQEPINKFRKGGNATGNRSHNVSNKRGTNQESSSSTTHENTFMNNFIIPSKLEGSLQNESDYASTIISKRNKTSEKNRMNNKLLYRRNNEGNLVKNQRANIDPHDMIFFHNPTLNTSPDSQNYNSAIQAQGSSFNQKVYATSKENKGKKQKLAQAMNPKQRNQDSISLKFLMNWESHNQQIQHIYQQSLKRQNKFNPKSNLPIGLIPSPYQSKNIKPKGTANYAGSKKNVADESLTPIKTRVNNNKTSTGEKQHSITQSTKIKGSELNNTNNVPKRNEINIENQKSSQENLDIQNSISRLKMMFGNVDSILQKYDDFAKDLSDHIRQIDTLEEDQIIETKREYNNCESDLESLLNCEDLSQDSERS